ncbi:MAG: AMP-binding protein [Proteobacteria bacterium]|nr:AMP-binding protein [Pseudomonadota bacterium]MBU0964812.1 AMP-binding protein [Pseudomonadota bacterium]
MSYNIAQTLVAVAAKFPERTGLIVPSAKGYLRWTFAELRENSARFANVLTQCEVRKGDRVMLMVKPSMEFVCLTFALFQMGAVVILIDPGMGYRNLLRCIGSVKPTVFIGIGKAHLFKTIFRKTFTTIRISLLAGPGFWPFARSLAHLAAHASTEYDMVDSAREELAAIIFTTGSTGPPKGVQYTHGIFSAQLQYIRNYYRITSYDRDQPAFPLFALFSTALGACAVIPDMDPSRPAQVDPQKFVKTIQDHDVTYSFGSPAIWNVVSRYCLEKKITLGVKKILMAGAPVSGELVERVKKIMAPGGEVFTPYGATESLPIVSISGTEILAETWPLTRKGKGTCVGRPLPGIEIRIMEPVEGAVKKLGEVRLLVQGAIGEIIVKGDVVTRAYDHNDRENSLAKISDGHSFWHRMGDMGYLDEKGRLWFCGRKAHRVQTESETLYTICCEAIFNEHPKVFRSALVGIGEIGRQLPVLIVEPTERIADEAGFFAELAELGRQCSMTAGISRFLIHPSFPVDIRHNAKIFREKLAVWAAERIGGGV